MTYTSTGEGSDDPLCCPTHRADSSHAAGFTYFSDYPDSIWTMPAITEPFFSWPVRTTISMINNTYYKCTLYYAFHEAFTNPWSLKHASQVKFHLSQNNMRVITLQHQENYIYIYTPFFQ